MLTEKDLAAKSIAGEITLSGRSCDSMRRWREVFGVRQIELAKRLELSPSVISDYESGRRQSPGISFVKRLVETLLEMDEERGGNVISRFAVSSKPDAILDMREFDAPIKAAKLIKVIDGEVIANAKQLNHLELRGYTVLDSIQAIMNLTEREFRTIYGASTERALIFTKVRMGRSPMIAVKVTQPKPCVVVLHGLAPKGVDKLARHIAERENIPLVVSRIDDEDELVEKLRRNLT